METYLGNTRGPHAAERHTIMHGSDFQEIVTTFHRYTVKIQANRDKFCSIAHGNSHELNEFSWLSNCTPADSVLN